MQRIAIKRWIRGVIAVAMATAAGTGPAMAQTAEANTPGVSASTPSLTAHLSERLDFRASFPATSAGHTGFERLSVKSQPMLGSGPEGMAVVDWGLDIQGLRLTGGALQHQDAYDHTADALGRRRMPAQPIDNVARWRPYLGLGWDNTSKRQSQLGIKLDIGVIFDGVGVDSGFSNDRPTRRDQKDFLRQEFESFRYTPSISADVEYRF